MPDLCDNCSAPIDADTGFGGYCLDCLVDLPELAAKVEREMVERVRNSQAYRGWRERMMEKGR